VLQTRPAPSEQLRRKIGLVLTPLVDVSERLATHPRLPELYPEYLRTSHGIIRASVPLMQEARERALTLSGDPVAAPLADYLEHHVEEELDHDEWLLGDLELLGVDRAAVLARPPSPGVAGLVGAQYYWVLHYHPVALLGYIAVLEGYPPSLELIDGMERRTGYDRRAFRTLIAHSELDPGHSDELFELVDRLPLKREQAGVIGLSAITTVERLTSVFEELAADFG
jgi:hypothetical protein